MTYVLLKASSLVVIILLGIYFRSSGLVPADAGQVVNKLMVRLTLPAAIIVSFSKIDHMDFKMALLALAGLMASVIMMTVGAILSRKQDQKKQALFMLCFPAVNIGSFAIPFTQSFLPEIGSVAACIYDVGNGFMCTGANYPIVSTYISGDHGKFSFKSFAKSLLSSAPLVTYSILFLLALLGIRVPAVVTDFITPIANANPFMAMMMLGLLFRLELKKEYMIPIFQILGCRQIFAVCASLFFYFCMPFELPIRQALVLVAFAPMSAIAPAYVGWCGGDEGMASCANSMSVLISVVEILCLVVLLGLY